MTELLTAAQMRAIEQAAIDSGEVTGLELMERAGQGVVDAILTEWPELRRVGETHRAVVLCGPGNNGGDGFVVARLLKEVGWEVEVFLYGGAEKLPPDARVNFEKWLEKGAVGPIDTVLLRDADVIVDAIFSTGLSRGFEVPEGPNEGFHALMADGYWWDGMIEKPYVVAVDVVSEMDSDSGKVLETESPIGGEMGAHLTVTFHRAKVGHYLSEGSRISGKTVIVDIELLQEVDPNARNRFLQRTDFVRLVGPPLFSHFGQNLTKHVNYPDPTGQHKYTHGHALILSGGVGKGGAARLAARGALRIGAGVVTLGTPPTALIENAAQLNAIMLRKIKGADALADTLQDKRINALCLGPGMGIGDKQAALLEAALAGEEPRPTVLDADALTLLANDTTLFGKLHAKCILTPHAGEFARLFPDIAAKLDAPATKGPAYSKVDATRDAAKRAGCVVLYKGPDTVIADPSGRCSINASVYERSAPWLATAGSGDVLAGFITGLLARGFQPMQAAETGAWLHTECALSFGPGLIAEDLPEELPKVFKELGL